MIAYFCGLVPLEGILGTNFRIILGAFILDQKSLTDIDTKLGSDGLNGIIYLLLMAHKGDAKLYKLIETKSGDLIHGHYSCSSEIVTVATHLEGE